MSTAMLPPSAAAPRLSPEREQLDNGLVLLSSRSDDTPAVALRASFPVGAARDPEERLGLAGFVARALRRGTLRRDTAAISEAVEAVGASFAIWAGTEEAGFSAKCLNRDLPLVLRVLREVLEEPAFSPQEVDRTRGELLTLLSERDDSTRARADLALRGLLYPAGHPYGRPSTGYRETISAITREELVDFHQEHYSAHGMLVSIAGSFDPDPVRRELSGWLQGRPGSRLPVTDVGAVCRRTEERISLPHKAQVDLLIGAPGVPRTHPDSYALAMMSLILGGLGLMGRLGARVREEQGLAYQASCRSNSRLWAGEWVASAGVSPQNVDAAHAAILAEVERLRREGVTEQELADARDYLIGSLPLRMETNDGIAAYMLNTEYYGLGLDYLWRYPELIRRETRESLRQAAVRYLDPDCFAVAIAGAV
ncbi:MAG: M16 family metallopeptidase [Armatimonadota bacterium]